MPLKKRLSAKPKTASKRRSPRARPHPLEPSPQPELPLALQRARLDPASLTSPQVLQLQRALGNQAVAGFLPKRANPILQPKELPSHKDPNWRPTRPPDMVPVNWSAHKGGPAPAMPYPVDLDPGYNPPKPPNTTEPKLVRPPTHHRREPEGPFEREQREADRGKVLWTHELSMARVKYWEAWGNDARQVQNRWNSAVPGMLGLIKAHEDESLQGRQLMLPSQDWTGSLAQLVSQQKAGGQTIGDIFSGEFSPSLDMSSDSKRALDKASGAGKKTTKDPFANIQEQEHGVDAAFKEVKATSSGLEKAHHSLTGAIADIETAKAEDDEAAAKAELEQLQSEIASAKAALKFVASIPARIANLDETIGDILKEGPTFLWELALDAATADDIAQIKQKITAAQAAKKTAQTKRLQANYNAAVAGVQEATFKFEAAQSRLKGQLVARVRAYDKAGEAARQAGGGGPGGRQIEAIISAIPRVETMVAKLTLVLETLGKNSDDPVYTEASGIGYGMALYDQKWEAFDFPNVLSWLWKCRWMYGEQLQLWQGRLDNLHQVKTKLEGNLAGKAEQ